jgi:hypothetical protein
VPRRDAPLPATDPFHDVGAASVRVPQQAHGMAKSKPRSSSYPLDPAFRDPSLLTLVSRVRLRLQIYAWIEVERGKDSDRIRIKRNPNPRGQGTHLAITVDPFSYPSKEGDRGWIREIKGELV